MDNPDEQKPEGKPGYENPIAKYAIDSPRDMPWTDEEDDEVSRHVFARRARRNHHLGKSERPNDR